MIFRSIKLCFRQPWFISDTRLFLSSLGVVLELTHNHGTENDPTFKVNNGNVEPNRGFGHLAVMTSDVYKECEELDRKGIIFQKRPDEGRMKGLAFILGALPLAALDVSVVIMKILAQIRYHHTIPLCVLLLNQICGLLLATYIPLSNSCRHFLYTQFNLSML